jgi:hypothetical protein
VLPLPAPEPAEAHGEAHEPTAPVAGDPASAPRSAALEPIAFERLRTELFLPGRRGLEIQSAFGADFAERPCRGRAALMRVERYGSDPVFAGGAGAKAVLESREPGDGRPLRVYVQIPTERRAALEPLRGDELSFHGRLVRCDPYQRSLHLADGDVEPA